VVVADQVLVAGHSLVIQVVQVAAAWLQVPQQGMPVPVQQVKVMTVAIASS
jgi:hypothetical protein